ncbi:MAG: hypothetical protein GAK37_00285 [Pseudomonas sp.]|nr:MAG: hypothetical protein GAK37_00285 [Pseudomonas sp.]
MGMATGVSICSNALLMLGAQTINDFSDQLNLDRAKLCANLYPTVRDDLIRQHPWNCCIKRVVLAPDAAAPAFGYSHSFELPADFMRVLEVGENGIPIDYLVEGRTIQASTTALELRYVFRNEIESNWDSSLVKLATLAMAAALAYPVTQSAAMQQTMEEKLEMSLRRARAVDGQEDPPQMLGDERLLASRFGSYW